MSHPDLISLDVKFSKVKDLIKDLSKELSRFDETGGVPGTLHMNRDVITVNAFDKIATADPRIVIVSGYQDVAAEYRFLAAGDPVFTFYLTSTGVVHSHAGLLTAEPIGEISSIATREFIHRSAVLGMLSSDQFRRGKS